jgi:hypothetical protein
MDAGVRRLDAQGQPGAAGGTAGGCRAESRARAGRE